MRYPTKFRERAVRLVAEQRGQGELQWKALGSVSSKLGCTQEALWRWVRQDERNHGTRAGLSTVEHERLWDIERENRQLKRAIEILRKASAFFVQAELDGPAK
jgi:transposase